jgi:hypothetical protein
VQDRELGVLAVRAVGAALIVLFAGAGVTLAVGHVVPTEFWAAASALTGALVGLLSPQPATKGTLQRQASRYRHQASITTDPVHKASLSNLADATTKDANDAKSYDIRIILLCLVGLAAFAIGLALVFKVGEPGTTTAYDTAVKNASDTLIAIGSGAAGALIGLLAPTPGSP